MARNFQVPDLILRVVSIVFGIVAAGLIGFSVYDKKIYDLFYNVSQPFFFTIILCLLCSVALVVVLLVVGLHSNEDIARSDMVFHVFGGLLLITIGSLFCERVHSLKLTNELFKANIESGGGPTVGGHFWENEITEWFANIINKVGDWFKKPSKDEIAKREAKLEQMEGLYKLVAAGAAFGFLQAIVMLIIRFISKSRLTILDGRALACNLGLLAFLLAEIAFLQITRKPDLDVKVKDIPFLDKILNKIPFLDKLDSLFFINVGADEFNITTTPANTQQEVFWVGHFVCFLLSVTFLFISAVFGLRHPMYILLEFVYHALAAVLTISISIVFILEVDEAKGKAVNANAGLSAEVVSVGVSVDDVARIFRNDHFLQYGAAAAAFGVAFGLALALIAVFIFLRYQRSAV